MKKMILTTIFVSSSIFAIAQNGTWGGSWGETSNEKPKKDTKKKDSKAEPEKPAPAAEEVKDSASTDGYGEWGSGESKDNGWEGGGKAWGQDGASGSGLMKPKNAVPVFVKEEKMFLPYDSIRKLIVYSGIKELEQCELCSEDSLYYRFKIWAEKEFGAKIFKDKKAIGLDQKFQKITMNVKVPLMIENNKFVSTQNGEAQVAFTIWFQPYRYKYLFTNFVHEVPPTGTQTQTQQIYFEYYQDSKNNIEGNNKILKAIDKKIKTWIDKIGVALNDKPISLSNEDDW